MPRIIDDKAYRNMMAELEEYRATGLTPKEIMAMMIDLSDPAPMPLPLYDDEDGYSAAAGILEDDDLAEITMASLDRERWEK